MGGMMKVPTFAETARLSSPEPRDDDEEDTPAKVVAILKRITERTSWPPAVVRCRRKPGESPPQIRPVGFKTARPIFGFRFAAMLVSKVHNADHLELEGASMRKTIAKMNNEMPQTGYPEHAASRQRGTGRRMPRNKWAHVVGIGGRMLQNTHSTDIPQIKCRLAHGDADCATINPFGRIVLMSGHLDQRES